MDVQSGESEEYWASSGRVLHSKLSPSLSLWRQRNTS